MPMPPLFTSPLTSENPAKFGPDHWNPVTALLTGLFDGPDADGTVLTRDSTSDTGATWVAGAVGPEGPAGPAGPAGETGATGTAGTNGTNGTNGAAGSQGIQGVTGPAGNDGAAGAAGSQGIQGIPGSQGIQGPAGELGLSLFRLTANGSALGPTIADFFGADSALATVENGIYELYYVLKLLKTTSGTLTITLTHTAAYANLVAQLEAASAITAIANRTTCGVVSTTAAAAALPVTPTLANGSNNEVIVRALAECTTAGNLRLRVTAAAGTVTPLRGSYYTARLLSAANVGTFVA